MTSHDTAIEAAEAAYWSTANDPEGARDMLAAISAYLKEMGSEAAQEAEPKPLNLGITKEWFEKRAALEGDLEIGAGKPDYIPGFVPSAADRHYDRIASGLLAENERLRKAAIATRSLVAEAAMVGFNYADGDWAERLFANQAVLSAAIGREGA